MLLSTWEPAKAEDRRTLNPSWPIRCNVETMMEQSGSGCHVMLHSYEFFQRLLLITELIGMLVIFEGRMQTLGTFRTLFGR